MHAREMHAHKMHAHKMHAHKMHAHEMHAHEMLAHEMHAHEMHAHKMQAHETHAHELHTSEMLTHEMYESGNFWFVLKHPSPYAGPRRRWPRVSEWDTALRIVWARCQNYPPRRGADFPNSPTSRI